MTQCMVGIVSIHLFVMTAVKEKLPNISQRRKLS